MSKIPLWKKGIVAVASLGLIAGGATVAKRVIDPGELVVSVIDGDTFIIQSKYKQNIRLFGADAPETKYCFGEESKTALSKKILGKKVILKEPKIDGYKRIVALVYVDGELVNEYMIKNGYTLHRWDTSTQVKILRDADQFARDNKLGIFSETCSPVKPPKINCTIKASIDHSDYHKTYTMPGCFTYSTTLVERYRGEDWFCTEREAQAAGYTKSPNCLPH